MSVCLLLCFHQSGGSLLSQTTEYVIIDNSYTLCPKSEIELSRVGAANFTQYQRQHKLAHSVHKKLLDNSEVHRVSVSHLCRPFHLSMPLTPWQMAYAYVYLHPVLFLDSLLNGHTCVCNIQSIQNRVLNLVFAATLSNSY